MKRDVSSGQAKTNAPSPLLSNSADSNNSAAAYAGKSLPSADAFFVQPHKLGSEIPQNVKQLITSLGLPPDALSASLISFARYFSLDLEPSRLLQFHRIISSFRHGREAAALGAAAAEDKGAVLTKESLHLFADAIDPGSRGGSGEDSPPGSNSGDSSGGGSGRSGSGTRDDAGDPEKKTDKPRQVPPDASAVREMAAAGASGETVQGILNRLPGKNGRRWAVFPFKFESQGEEFAVTVRILLIGENNSSCKAGRLAADIRSSRRRWLFVLDRPGEADSAGLVQVSPMGAERKKLERELSELLAGFVRRVRVVDGDGFSWFPDGRNDELPSVNEEV
ncbi:hypothetical protein [Breznakiella homolactica]|uniref:Uncharacterized protein n=1 Tax=Breznakiella homolactica TaxID=2798577 RepID=A0A7T7XNP3_9SPIR|nr:hypothetical protein [Breznakiella homolactica]QQO09704.1 hypothetical protein JFL75_01950 [Breznakiella homolactica]